MNALGLGVTNHVRKSLLEDPEEDRCEIRFEASEVSQKLAGSVETLEERIDHTTREERQSEAMKLAKDEALRRYNKSFLWIARTVESLCRLAGLDEVAKRVRPSSRRPGVTARKFVKPEDEQSEGNAEGGTSEGEGSSESSSEAAASEAPRSSE